MAGRQRAFSIANLLPSRRNSGFFPDPSKSIHISALNNDVEGVKLIIRKEKTALNSVDPSTGQTALHIVVFEGYAGLASVLIELGADVNKRDTHGWTALHSCCKGNSSNFVEIARLLIVDGKAQVHALTNSGGTPLHYFVQGESANSKLYEETIQLMIERGADINSQTKYGETPLHLSSSRGKLFSSQLLVKFGAEINLRNKDGETALHLAIKHGFQEIAIYLLNNGADPSIEAKDGCSRQYCRQFNQNFVLSQINSKSMIKNYLQIINNNNNDTNDENNNQNNNNDNDDNNINNNIANNIDNNDNNDNVIVEVNSQKRKLEIDPEMIGKVEKMGYDSASIMIALFNLHKRGKATSRLSCLIAELNGSCATNVSECKICLEERIDCVILPCRHSCLCVSCAQLCKNSRGECPICRENIDEIIQFYLS